MLKTVDDYKTMENWEHMLKPVHFTVSSFTVSARILWKKKCINSIKSTKVQRELRRIQRKGEPFLIVSVGFTVHDVNLHK